MHASRNKRDRVPKLFRWTQRSEQEAKSPNPMQRALDSIDSDAPPIPASRGSLYRSGLRLSDLQPGECGTIRRFLGTQAARLRLMEMGLIPGVHVRVIRTAAFGGPIDLLVRGYQLSLRREEAALIWLGEEDDERDKPEP